MTYESKRALVIGLGRSGLAAVRFLAARGAEVVAADTRPEGQLAEAVSALDGVAAKLHFGGHPEKLFRDKDLVIPSPGVPWDLPPLVRARQRGTTVCGELDLAATELRGRVIGVTGTNGKTTTASLIDHLLRAAGTPGRLAGNIGTPVLDIVDGSRDDHWHVLELSSFQLEASAAFRCHVAAVLNLTPDHLDRHRTLRRYAAAKARILRNQRPRDTAVLNADDLRCTAMEGLARGRVIRFAQECREGVQACVAGGRIVFRDEDIATAELPIKGAHNLENALAAVAACRAARLPAAAMGAALAGFRPVPHRMEFVASVRGVDYFNDSKATNVAAAVKACGSFPSGLWAILGGRDKGSDFGPLADVLRPRARAALLVGEAAPDIRRALGGSVPAVDARTLPEALRHAAARAVPGDTVLLAPACASFDQFRDYIDRGRKFRRIVRELEA